MKRIKLILPITTIAASSVMPILLTTACGTTNQTNKVVPTDAFIIENNRLYGLKKGTDLSLYDSIIIPSNTKTIEESAFADESIDYSNIKNLTIPRSVRVVKDLAFASLLNLDTIDLSEFNIEDSYYSEWGKNLFGPSLSKYRYVYTKLNDGLTILARDTIINKLCNAGASLDWFVEATNGNATLATSKEKEINDKSELVNHNFELTNLITLEDSFKVTLHRIGGTKDVSIALNSVSVNEQILSISSKMVLENEHEISDGNNVSYKVVISCRNSNKVKWVQIFDEFKLTYKKPKI